MSIFDAIGSSIKSVVSGVEKAFTPKPIDIPPLPNNTPTINSTPITKGAFPNRVTPYAPTTPDLKSLISAPIQSTVPKITLPTISQSIAKPIQTMVPKVNIVPPPVRTQDFKDVVNMLPAIAGFLGKGIVDPSLSLYQAVSGKTAPELKIKLPFSDEKHGKLALESQTSQKFYTDQLDAGVDPHKAFWNTAIKTGLDMANLVTLGMGLSKFALLKLTPEKLIDPELVNFSKENLRDYFSGRKTAEELNIPRELRQSISETLKNGTREDVKKLFNGIDMTTAKPSTLGKIFGVDQVQADKILSDLYGGPVRESPAGALPGYRSEPGQAPAFGLSTEKVEPVGFHDYNEPSVDINADPNAPKDVKTLLTKPINEVVGTAKIGDTTISIPKGGKIAIPESKAPGLFDKPVSRAPVYEGEKDLTTQTLNKLKGRSTVSKTFIENLTNQPDLKQTERDIIREKLKDYPDGSQVPVAEFAGKVKVELLPLKRSSAGDAYEPVTLPADQRGEIDKYEAHIYNSPIKTSAGGIHFGDKGEPSKNYFGHTRTEDVVTGPNGESNTRRVIEVQSDLYQKGNLEREFPKVESSAQNSKAEIMRRTSRGLEDLKGKNLKDFNQLNQYNDPTAHFRIVREEIKKAAEDGKTKLQFPTGETAMKIEGLGERNSFRNIVDNKAGEVLKPTDLIVGKTVFNRDMTEDFIITDVLGDGKFKAVPLKDFENSLGGVDGLTHKEQIDYARHHTPNVFNNSESFDISGKVDTNNPIYRFYEKDLGRYLTNKYGAQVVTDKQGVKWYEVPVSKDMASAVTAFSHKPKFFSMLRGKQVPLSEITKAIYKDIPKPEVRLIFTDELINGESVGMYSKVAKGSMDGMDWYKPALKPIIKLYKEGELSSLTTVYHESGHYILDNFMSPSEKQAFIDQAKKELGPIRDLGYKLRGYKASADERAEEYLVDKYADAKVAQYEAEAKGESYEYDPKHKSFFDKLDSILKKIVDTYKKVIERIKKLHAESGEGGYIKNPLADDTPEKVGEITVGDKKVDVAKGGMIDISGDTVVERLKKQEIEIKQHAKEKVANLKLDIEKLESFGISANNLKQDIARTVEEANLAMTGAGQAIKLSGEGIPIALTSRQKKLLSSSRFSSSSEQPLTLIQGEEGSVRSLEIQAQEALSRSNLASNEIEASSLSHIIDNYQTPVNKKINWLDFFRTDDRVLKKIGLGDEAEFVREQYDKYIKELPENIKKITDWSKKIDPKTNSPVSSERIFKYLDGQPLTPTPIEKAVSLEIKPWLKEWAVRLGLPEDKIITHYITHIFDDQITKKEFDEDLAKIIDQRVPGAVYDPFLEKRLGQMGYKQDAWTALDAYVKRATRKVYMDPALEKIQTKIGSTAELSNIELSQWKYVQKYINNVNLRPTDLDTYIDNGIKTVFGYKFGQRPVANITRSMRQWTSRAMLGLNVSSALRNLSQGVNTYAKLGEKYTAIGYTKLFSPRARAELESESVLGNDIIQDRQLSATKKTLEKVDKGLFYLFETVEKINRGAAYFGAKAKFIAENSKKLSDAGLIRYEIEEQAVRYAKKIVRDTQFTFGSIDTPVALQSDLAKTLGQYASYPIKQAEFLIEMAQNKEFAGLIRYILAGLLFVYTIGKLYDMKPTELIPWYRFGVPPSLKVPTEIVKAVINAPDTYGRPRTLTQKGSDIGKAIITGLIPGGNQLRKTYRGAKEITPEMDIPQKTKLLMFGKPYVTPTPKDTSPNAIVLSEASKKTTDERKAFRPTYDRITKLWDAGKTNEAKNEWDKLSTKEQGMFKTLSSSDKSLKTKESQKDIVDEVQKVISLVKEGKTTEANAIWNNLDSDQQKAFTSVYKKLNP